MGEKADKTGTNDPPKLDAKAKAAEVPKVYLSSVEFGQGTNPTMQSNRKSDATPTGLTFGAQAVTFGTNDDENYELAVGADLAGTFKDQTLGDLDTPFNAGPITVMVSDKGNKKTVTITTRDGSVHTLTLTQGMFKTNETDGPVGSKVGAEMGTVRKLLATVGIRW